MTRTAFSVKMENLPEEHENIKLVFFADLHLRKETIHEKIFDELVEKVNRENADFILIGGDLVDRTVRIKSAFSLFTFSTSSSNIFSWIVSLRR